ncbi:MAG: hypothetical protein IKC46_08555 [Lachnospiraceae bacterium]|nr:hypothetical protein [Lachnospiraceae bacterium]
MPDNGHCHAEDLAQKAAVAYFGSEVLAWLNIRERTVAAAPTEHVQTKVRHTYEDFNYIMENGEWYHFEFESGKVTRKALKRFREYEATTSYVHDVDVVTYIICSDAGQKVIEELNTGINTYRVRMILLKDFSVDEIIENLQRKAGSDILSQDLIPIALSPLLGGKMSMEQRVRKSFQFLKEQYPQVGYEQIKSLVSILIMLGEKFLGKEKMEQFKEEYNMTHLSQLVFNDGFNDGFNNGKEAGLQDGIRAMVRVCLSLELTRETILSKLQTFFDMSEEKANEYYDKFSAS